MGVFGCPDEQGEFQMTSKRYRVKLTAEEREELKALVVYKFICKNEKRAVTTDGWLESDVSSGMWRCLDAEPRPGANHS